VLGSHFGSNSTLFLQAFRPGIVDMTEDQLAVSRNAITLQGNGLDLDVLLPDVNWYVYRWSTSIANP
jgi:hypothetical protein